MYGDILHVCMRMFTRDSRYVIHPEYGVLNNNYNLKLCTYIRNNKDIHGRIVSNFLTEENNWVSVPKRREAY